MEYLTDTIEREATELLARIDAMGGTLAAIEQGAIQRMIQDAAYSAQQAVDAKEAIVVGVNKYVTAEKTKPEVFRVDPKLEQEQVERVRNVRASRSQSEWRAALDAIDEAARGGENLMPRIIAAVEAKATLGEIADTMRAAFGEYEGAGGQSINVMGQGAQILVVVGKTDERMGKLKRGAGLPQLPAKEETSEPAS